MSNSPDLTKLSKRERRLYFKELQNNDVVRQKRRSLLTKVSLSVGLLVLIAGLGYFWLTAAPDSQKGSANKGLEQTTTLKIGSAAPNFSLPSVEDGTVSLKDYQGKNVLLYFQEGLMCQPCWKQIGTLESDLSSFENLQTEIVTIGVDSASEWQPVLQAEGVKKIPVLVDANRAMSKDYGVLSMSSQMHSDRPGHTFVLVNKQGKIAWIADYPTMRVSNEEILTSVSEALKKTV